MVILTSLIIKIKAAHMICMTHIILKKSIFLINILECLYKEGYIRGFVILENSNYVLILLKYVGDKPVLENIKRISISSKRIYITIKELTFLDKKKQRYLITTTKGLFISIGLPCLYNIYKEGGEILFRVE